MFMMPFGILKISHISFFICRIIIFSIIGQFGNNIINNVSKNLIINGRLIFFTFISYSDTFVSVQMYIFSFTVILLCLLEGLFVLIFLGSGLEISQVIEIICMVLVKEVLCVSH